MAIKIFPPIGIARLGNDPNAFFIGPEIPGHPGADIDSTGNETVIQHHKSDEDHIKRQAARFRLFDVPDDGSEPMQFELPEGGKIEWSVHLANKKAAVLRGDSPLLVPTRPVFVGDPAPLTIDAGQQSISGANTLGKKLDAGSYLGRNVPLGELRTDAAQNLIVLGGSGFSSSPTNAGLNSFYTNPGWHDDTSDGTITAKVTLPDGEEIVDIASACVVVAPPDYAPEIEGVVTLYDILLQIGIDNFGHPKPTQISFTNHVYPILQRVRRLQWVNNDPNWETMSSDVDGLANNSVVNVALRESTANIVFYVENALSRLSLTAWQTEAIESWAGGDFLSDWAGVPDLEGQVTAVGLTRAALDGTVGQGFFPGIEAGILMTDPTLYLDPFDFRVDISGIAPGDLTALMAFPWQADFYDCTGGWWPTQRPETVLESAASTNTVNWDRGASSHVGMVQNHPNLAFITAQTDANGNVVFAEERRGSPTAFV